MSDQTSNDKLPTGVFAFKPHEKAPPFVKAVINIDPNALIEYCNANPTELTQGQDGKWRLKMQILESQDGTKFYAKVDTYKPQGK